MSDMSPFSRLSFSPRQTVGLVFLYYGFLVGLWGGSVAVVTDISSLDPAMLGLAFSGFAITGMIGMAGCGVLARFFRFKTMILLLLIALELSLALLLHAHSVVSFGIGIAVLGAVVGMLDITMNSEGMAVETSMKRPVLAGFHGAASLGVGFGSLLGGYVSVRFGVWATALIGLVVCLIAVPIVLRFMPNRTIDRVHGISGRQFRLSRVLLLMGIVVGASAVGEFTAALFSAPFLSAQAPQFAAYAGAGGSVFAFCQAIMRFQADGLRRRFGDASIFGTSLLAAGLGYAVLSISPSFTISALGFAIVGLGTACVVPCAFAMAATQSNSPASSALAALSTVGTALRVPAPWVFGEIVLRFSYGAAFAACVAMFIFAFGITILIARLPKTIGSQSGVPVP